MTASNISPGGRALCARVVASNSGENGWRQREPSQGGARRSLPKGFDLRRLRCNPKADVDFRAALPSPCEEKKKQRHSRGEMRSEHNRGASLGAFLLAVSTMTLLFVSPVEGQVGQQCNMTALPGETGSCDDESGGTPQYCGESSDTTTGLNQVSCQSCAAVYDRFIENPTPFNCVEYWDRGQGGIDIFVPTTTITNCALSCFNATRCYTDADCPADRPDCTVSISGPFLVELNDEGILGTVPDSGECVAECGTNADCPADRPLCDAGQCLAECDTNADCPADRPLCESGQCLAECGTNADCPADRPICNAGQCEISVFSPLDGMGGGSSA